MLKQIYKNNLTVNYKTEGQGDAIILIHGFLESLETWSDFSLNLSKTFKVITVDLPGHGGSSLHTKPYTMCKYAESIYEVIISEDIEKAFVIGHSMGGYIALAFAENYPEKLSGLSLFHSSPFSDNTEKKENRTKTIKQFKTSMKDEICENHSRNVYANDNISLFKKEISAGIQRAKSLTTEGITASIETMRDRKDRSDILKKCSVPFLYIKGMKDKFIPAIITDLISMPVTYEILTLENSGHMGMVEEKEKSLKSINDFYNLYIKT